MKEEIRDYKLVRWYPSLPIKWDSTHSYQYNRKLNVMVNITLRDMGISPYVQSMPLIEPDFIEYWEKNKQKPLFITEDDIEIFDDTTEIISVSIKHHTVSKWGYRYLSKPLDCENFKYFGIEANADKYIEENKPKPLFITEDGVEVFDRDKYFSIGYDFNKRNMIAYNCDAPYSTDVIRFKHESYADKYIWRNKPVFSYEDFIKWANDINASFEELSQLAKERSKQ